ncbi:phosphotransferase enzyme family protein [Lentzea sp. NPDC102401]|uniref:phosphotransferase enzyme family protein n=1 Tax=Lentzea sp. NPDC102401 TaxID=3364128 RepID=UPI0037F653BC
MSATGPDAALPGPDQLRVLCAEYGADSAGATLLHARSNAVYLLPNENLVVRMAPATDLRRQRARTVIEVTRWLAEQDPTIALPPAGGDQPIEAAGAIATFWPYRPTHDVPAQQEIAGLIRRLHNTPVPPFSVPPHRPLVRLREALHDDRDRPKPILSEQDRTWLQNRAEHLVQTYSHMDWPLGIGLVHCDVHDENIVDSDGWKLIDFDQVCLGPREFDLVSALPDHFHQNAAERQALLTAYGYDMLSWPGWVVVRDIIEMHSLASYLRLATSVPAAAAQLTFRVASLRNDDRTARWTAVS